MICPGCGAAVPDASTFCAKCGKPLPAAPPAPASAAPPPVPAPAMTPPAPPARRAYVGPPQSSGKAIGSLVLGIFGFLLSWVLIGIPLAIVAIVLGHISYSQIKNSAGRLTGQGKAITGLVLGYLSVVTLPFALIVLAIAIPNLLRARMNENQAEAIKSVRTLVAAETTYVDFYRGPTCNLSELDGTASAVTAADASHALLIDAQLASGVKNGYRFELRDCRSAPSQFKIFAEPVEENVSGLRTYCADQTGVIRFWSSAEDCLREGRPIK